MSLGEILKPGYKGLQKDFRVNKADSWILYIIIIITGAESLKLAQFCDELEGETRQVHVIQLYMMVIHLLLTLALLYWERGNTHYTSMVIVTFLLLLICHY